MRVGEARRTGGGGICCQRIGGGADTELVGILIEKGQQCSCRAIGYRDVGCRANSAAPRNVADGGGAREQEISEGNIVAIGQSRDHP